MKWRGGFRTRYWVAWARGLARTVLRAPDALGAALDAEFEAMRYEDMQRTCSHPDEACYRPETWSPEEGMICRACSGVVVR